MFNQIRIPIWLLALALALGFLLDRTREATAAEIVCLRGYDISLAELERRVAIRCGLSEYRPPPAPCGKALLRGTIEKGDYERFLAFYKQHHHLLGYLKLLSPGGDAEEAMKIGRLVRKYLITAEAPQRTIDGSFYELPSAKVGANAQPLCSGPACVCASACALIWFGAVDRSGAVGLHRPRITDPQFTALPPGEASTVYTQALQGISRYLEEMEVPRPLIDAMIETSSSEVRWVNTLDDSQLEHPPSFAEWADASCGVTSQERKMAYALGLRKGMASIFPGQFEPLTAHEESLLKKLDERSTKWHTCKAQLVSTRRCAIPAP